MYGFIYETTNLINGKKYIGMHKSNVFDSYLGSGKILQKAIKKYGKENFCRKILQTANSLDELKNLEIFYIDKFNACNSEEYYNIAEGGIGGNLIIHYSEAQKEEYLQKLKVAGTKYGKTLKGVRRPKEVVEKMKTKAKERWENISEQDYAEFVEIMSNAVKGVKNPNYGNKWTEEQKKALSVKRKINGKLKGDKNPMFGHVGENALNGKTVYCYKNGILFKTFNTKQMVLDWLGLKGHTQLNNAIKNNTLFKGYTWKMDCNNV